jgi:hypothetical protein
MNVSRARQNKNCDIRHAVIDADLTYLSSHAHDEIERRRWKGEPRGIANKTRAAKFCEDWINVVPENAGKRGEVFESIPSRRQAEPTTDYISVEHNFTEVCVLARPLAELIAPPTMRHHAETPATMIADLMLADLRLSHHTLAQQFDGSSLR